MVAHEVTWRSHRDPPRSQISLNSEDFELRSYGQQRGAVLSRAEAVSRLIHIDVRYKLIDLSFLENGLGENDPVATILTRGPVS